MPRRTTYGPGLRRLPRPRPIRLDRVPAPELYARLCPDCGHLELSESPALVTTWRECPNCDRAMA